MRRMLPGILLIMMVLSIPVLLAGCKKETSSISPFAFLGGTDQPGWYTFIGAPAGGSSYDRPASVVATADGGYIFCGIASANIATIQSKLPVNDYSSGIDMLVVKTDSTGNVEWYTFLGGSGSDIGSCVSQTSDGGYIISGNSDSDIESLQSKTPVISYSSSSRDMLVIKLDTSGNVSWLTFIGSSGWDNAYSVKQTADGGYIVAGSGGANIASLNSHNPKNDYTADSDMLAVKLDSAGEVSWYTFLGSSGWDCAYTIEQTSDNDYILGGVAEATIASIQLKTPIYAYSTGKDMLVVKLDYTGNTEWFTFIGTSGPDEASAVRQTADGGYILSGVAGANLASLDSKNPLNPYAGAVDWMVMKLDSSGHVSWYSFFGTAVNEQAYTIRQTSDNGYIVAGYAGTNIASIGSLAPLNPFAGGSDMLLIKLNASGEPGWYTFIGGAGSDYAHDVQVAPDGGYIVAGSCDNDMPALMTYSPVVAFNDGDDWCLVKLEEDGAM